MPSRLCRRWSFSITAAITAALAGCADRPALPASVPSALQVPTNQTLILKAQAMGVQIYRCEPAADDPDRFEWRLAAPQADLFDKRGKHVGRHYAGPTWEATDGSRVVAEVTARAKSPDSFAIDWLLLKAKSATGKGRFGTVQYVQRLDTAGGKAPATGCDAGHAGGEVRIGYRAYYYFYSPKP